MAEAGGVEIKLATHNIAACSFYAAADTPKTLETRE